MQVKSNDQREAVLMARIYFISSNTRQIGNAAIGRLESIPDRTGRTYSDCK